MKTYLLKFNDFGSVYIIANSFAEAELKFIKSGYGGDNYRIKSIEETLETNIPIV